MTDISATDLARHETLRTAASSPSRKLSDLATTARGLSAALVLVACLGVPDSALRQKSFKSGMAFSNMLHRAFSGR